MQDSSVLIIYTGGTIGMVQDPETGSLMPFDFEHLSNEIPEIKKFNYKIDTISFESPIDSSNMTPKIWADLANLIGENYEKYDGFVILHGSDTMAYTASALSFMLEDLNKPVILTGSQLPIGVIRTDGKENLITAIEIAAAKIHNTPVVPEVAIYFEYSLYRGNRTSKISASHFEAFASPNYPNLAEAGIEINYNYGAIKVANENKFNVFTQFDNNVAVLKLFPGINQAIVNSILNSSGVKAIVMETYGSGNATNENWFINELKQAREKGVEIINVTQCLKGFVKQGHYETSASFEGLGIISGENITTETALTKSMYLLGKGHVANEFKISFLKSFCGEI